MDSFEIFKPRAIPVVLANDDHTFCLDEEALSKILMQDGIKDRNVVVISVAGAFRHGKSFLLDFFLRYMNSKVKSNLIWSISEYKDINCSMYSKKIHLIGLVRMMHLWRVFLGEEALNEIQQVY